MRTILIQAPMRTILIRDSLGITRRTPTCRNPPRQPLPDSSPYHAFVLAVPSQLTSRTPRLHATLGQPYLAAIQGFPRRSIRERTGHSRCPVDRPSSDLLRTGAVCDGETCSFGESQSLQSPATGRSSCRPVRSPLHYQRAVDSERCGWSVASCLRSFCCGGVQRRFEHLEVSFCTLLVFFELDG